MWIVPSLLYIIFYKILTTWVFQNKLGDTALHAAAWKGYSDIVELLLQKSECLILPHVWFHKRKLIWECPASHKKPESCRKLWLKSLSVRYPPPPVQFRVSGGWSLSQHHLVIKWFFFFKWALIIGCVVMSSQHFLHSPFHINKLFFVSDPRTDIRNNENKLAEDMATNAQSASLLKRKHQSSKSGGHERAVLQRPFMLQPFKVQKYFKPCMFSFLELQQIASAIISYSVWEIPLNSSMRLLKVGIRLEWVLS